MSAVYAYCRATLWFLLGVLLVISSAGRSWCAGSSLVVLVDFSQSFAPLSPQDERALREVSWASAKLAQQEWESPVAVLWSRIQTASLTSTPLCVPFAYQELLIKRDNEGSANIGQKLEECTRSTVRSSRDPSQQTPNTDISGAIELAAEQAESVLGAKYLIIISDFMEDLPRGKRPVKYQLHGEHVLLLHRSGTDRTPMEMIDHLERIRRWTHDILRAGASSVVDLPLSSVTAQRVMRALGAKSKTGTDVVVLQGLPDTARPENLKMIATAVGKAALDWPSPLTLAWADMRAEPNPPWQMPPLELISQLVKTPDGSSSMQDFLSHLNECAEGMQRFYPGAANADIAASISYYVSAGTLDAQHIFLIISSFPDLPQAVRDLAVDLTGVKVVMLPAPNREDASDESAYTNRVTQWQRWLDQRHAHVCRIPFNGLTNGSLLGCMDGH